MQDLIPITYTSDRPTVSGRALHDALEVKTEYRHWFGRMTEYGFTEGADFNPVKIDRVQMEGKREVTRTVEDHQLTLDMAKELCMIQRTDKGKECRQYFLAVERQWNSPEAIMARALQMANRKLEEATGEVKRLTAENAALVVDKATMQPKAEYFDELVDRNLLTGFRETAKLLGVKQRKFIDFLLEHKYIYRDQKGALQAYAKHKTDGLFENKECFNEKSTWKGTQTMITPKGRETFRLLCQGM
jgi:anti-repressor protein